MKKNDFQELKVKPIKEIERYVSDSKERLRALKFDLAAGKVKNVREIRILRKDIARALTLISENKNK